MAEPEHVNSANYAYGLIGAYAIVYLGIAVCKTSWLDGNSTNSSTTYRSHMLLTSTRHTALLLWFEEV
jgi:hypothetical protein